MAACALTMSSSMPHLQAAQRRICSVVPVKFPSTRLSGALAPATVCPTVWLAVALTALFSGIATLRTAVAHCASDGSLAPGGSNPKWLEDMVVVFVVGLALVFVGDGEAVALAVA